MPAATEHTTQAMTATETTPSIPATTPPSRSCATGYGNKCYSPVNTCNQRWAGVIKCDGTCSASSTPPPDSNCPANPTLGTSVPVNIVGRTVPVTTTIRNNQTTLNQNAAVSTSKYNFTKSLSLGSTGAEVVALQNLLYRAGDYTGPITGYFGQLTKQAVIKYQKAHNLEAVGNVGQKTRASLNQ